MTKLLDWMITYLMSVVGALWLYTIGWVFPRHRALVHLVAERLGLRKPKRSQEQSGGLPVVSLEDVVTMPVELRLFHPSAEDGNVTTGELVAILALAKLAARTEVFEIGTFNGRTTLNLAANLGGNIIVNTLDLPPSARVRTKLKLDEADVQFAKKERVGEMYIRYGMEQRIRQHFGDSATFDFSPYFGRIDVVFVDGSHSYEYVVNDTLNAIRMVRPGGLIMWHDYGAWAGVTQALDEMRLTHPSLGQMRHIRGTTIAYAYIGPQDTDRPIDYRGDFQP